MMNLPSREEVEGWDWGEVAAFMHQMRMYECAVTINRHQINGHRFLNMTENDLRKFSPILQPQLQKIVQDIRKHDGSLLDKLRRLKSKPAPRIPARDYRDDDREASEGSDPEYDCDTYEDPTEEHDNNYEPPPSQPQRVFSTSPLPQGEYLDSCRGRPERPPKKPLRPVRAEKMLPPTPGPHPQDNDEEDYVTPDGSNDDDNYIEPDENPPNRGRAVRELPRLPPQPLSISDCHKVPDTEVQLKPKPPPGVSRLCPVPPQPHPLPPKPSPRFPPRTPTPDSVAEHNDEYEVCDANDRPSDVPRESRPLPQPKPLPRERSPMRPTKPKIPSKPLFREFENRTSPVSLSEPPTPSKAFSLDFKRPKLPIPSVFTHRHVEKDQHDSAENSCEDKDEESEMLSCPWFADPCDRKTADDVLLQTSKDGAFLVRRSSGHDAQQPYTLVVLYNDRVYNIPIRYLPDSQQFALGREKKGEEHFSSVPHIVEHHQRTPLVLIDSQSNSKDATRLCFPVKP